MRKIRKHKPTIRDFLGFTQEELAMILKVTRSQLSMYEIGKGNLPLAAIQLLAEMLKHVMAPEMANKKSPYSKQQHAEVQQKLEELKLENDYQLQKTARKIATIEKKHANRSKALPVLDFLTVHSFNKDVAKTDLLRDIAYKVSRSLEVEGLAVLEESQIKLEVLEFEKKVIESRLGQITIVRSGDL
ncbi:MAG: helix-turn-helix domain-containing protein [Flavobacterium sp.]|uniref:helix-turn-helix domain-containing protein n=1 Tax=Flavobacterium sp. TaxID=239 RepID=UPI003265B9FA